MDSHSKILISPWKNKKEKLSKKQNLAFNNLNFPNNYAASKYTKIVFISEPILQKCSPMNFFNQNKMTNSFN